jgi:Flp pilus assembly protein TadD
MLIDQEVLKSRELAVRKRKVEIGLRDEGNRRSQLLLPPVDELRRREPLAEKNYDAKRLSQSTAIDIEVCQQEFNRLMEKYDRFKDSATYLTRLASLSQLCGDKAKALNFSRAAAVVGGQPIFQYRTAEMALDAGQVDAADEMFRKLDTQKYGDASLRLAEHYISEGDFAEAQKHVNRALEFDILDWRAQIVAGTLSLVRGDYRHAIRHYRVALDGRPNSSLIYANLAISQYLLGNVGKALKEIRKSIALNPTNKNALTFLADVSIGGKRDLGIVTRYLESYLIYHPESKTIIERLAKAHYVLEDYSSVINVLERAKQYVDNPSIWNNIGAAYASKRNLRTAMLYFHKALQVEDVYSDRGAEFATTNLVAALVDLGKYTEAEEIAETYITECPDERYIEDKVLSKMTAIFVWILICRGRHKDAIRLAAKSLQHTNVNITLKLRLSQILSSQFSVAQSQLDEAYRYARQGYDALWETDEDIEPDMANMIVNNLVFVLIEQGKMEEAQTLIRTLRTNVSRGAEFAYATKGLYALRRGDVEKGEQLYKMAIGRTENSKQKNLFRQKLYLELGKHWINSGDRRRAEQNLKKAVKLKACGHPMKGHGIYQSALTLLKEMKIEQ